MHAYVAKAEGVFIQSYWMKMNKKSANEAYTVVCKDCLA